MRLEGSAAIPSAPDRVWSLLVDWEGQAGWMPDVAWIRVLGNERALGARLAVRTRVLGVPLATDLIEVTGWDPPRRLAVRHTGMVSGVGEWTLQPDGRGGTRFAWREELRMAPPILGAVALWLYGPVQRAMLRRSLRNLARMAQAV